MMDPNFIGDGGGGNFSKTAGYQEGHSSNLFLVQREQLYSGQFLISELGIFN